MIMRDACVSQGWRVKGSANRTEVDHGRKSCERSEDVELFPWEEVTARGLHENASYRISLTTSVQTILKVTRFFRARDVTGPQGVCR